MILLDAIIYEPNVLPTQHHFTFNLQHIQLLYYLVDTMDFWPFAREYSIWNITVAALQFWTADLKPHILSNAIE